MKKHRPLPGAYVALTKDTRYAGTYEVLVPTPDRVKPHRVPLQFPTEQSAGTWIHSPEGIEMIAQLLGLPQK